jgi:hypothetical protein
VLLQTPYGRCTTCHNPATSPTCPTPHDRNKTSNGHGHAATSAWKRPELSAQLFDLKVLRVFELGEAVGWQLAGWRRYRKASQHTAGRDWRWMALDHVGTVEARGWSCCSTCRRMVDAREATAPPSLRRGSPAGCTEALRERWKWRPAATSQAGRGRGSPCTRRTLSLGVLQSCSRPALPQPHPGLSFPKLWYTDSHMFPPRVRARLYPPLPPLSLSLSHTHTHTHTHANTHAHKQIQAHPNGSTHMQPFPASPSGQTGGGLRAGPGLRSPVTMRRCRSEAEVAVKSCRAGKRRLSWASRARSSVSAACAVSRPSFQPWSPGSPPTKKDSGRPPCSALGRRKLLSTVPATRGTRPSCLPLFYFQTGIKDVGANAEVFTPRTPNTSCSLRCNTTMVILLCKSNQLHITSVYLKFSFSFRLPVFLSFNLFQTLSNFLFVFIFTSLNLNFCFIGGFFWVCGCDSTRSRHVSAPLCNPVTAATVLRFKSGRQRELDCTAGATQPGLVHGLP